MAEPLAEAFKVLLLDGATAIGGSGPPGPTTPKRIVIAEIPRESKGWVITAMMGW